MKRPLLERVTERVARELIDRLGVSPRYFSYRHLRTCSPLEFPYREIHPAEEAFAPLPLNVTAREQLSRDRRVAGFSFYDVPQRTVAPTFVATIPDCRVLITENEWRDRFYAIITADDRLLNLRGTEFRWREHGALLRAGVPETRYQHGTWILELWDRNYGHWLQWHLTKIVQLQDEDSVQNLLIPPRAGFVDASLSMLEVKDAIEVKPGIIHARQITVMGMDSYRPSLLRALRQRFARNREVPPGRKLFISRREVTRRRLANEQDCWPILEAHGFESVVFERIPFAEQVSLMQEAAVVVGLHGSGFANLLFAPEGAHVLELADETFPNPQFYALASVLGHHYWLVHARPTGDPRPGYHDLLVDAWQLENVLSSIDAARR